MSEVGDAWTTAEREEARRLFASLRRSVFIQDSDVRDRLEQSAVQILRLAGAGCHHGATTGARLTSREIDVLAHAAIGARNAEIAAEIGVSTETVKAYLRSLMNKMGVHSRGNAIERAREWGVIP